MTYYHPHHSDLDVSLHRRHGQWNDGSMVSPGPNTVGGMNAANYSLLQGDVGFHCFPNAVPHFSASHHGVSSVPIHIPSDLPSNPSSLHHCFESSYHGQPFQWANSTHHSPSGPTLPSAVPAPTNNLATPPTLTPVIVPSTNPSQRAKFACPSCGKLCTSRPRAYTCFLNHIGSKPFSCNGTCGLVNCVTHPKHTSTVTVPPSQKKSSHVQTAVKNDPDKTLRGTSNTVVNKGVGFVFERGVAIITS
ncbi:hypothetical protein CPB86DRAFT_810721 [Serendipita vermifera]|nr:hypothetical protein CPB86DRAFT_810721 [Serendipita vermifera]